ncbi:oxygenase [Ktedonobacter sp. SOSP1-85]|uniref:FAD-dependent monooxygenase n=1 Tax=Ktedonobacter sp. SOSP1-85 TaxID=2778367 RepID=UPI001915174B|nr:FAD-dependent monooxygenase [Ktedonobacter sp. SOSP1-85]GHO78301.1 oxygenase [Ktedonobacter sp. SOSP1-85]
MSQTPPPSDVLIIGAGPTGLTLAHELLRRGITPRLIEKTPSASPNSKALGVMARTLELLASSGITKEMLAQGVKVPTLQVWSLGRHLARFDFATGIDSPYPFILMIPQHTTEAILTRHLVRLGGTVERGVELVGLTQRDDRVEVVLRSASGKEKRSSCRFLIGCDGAHSSVRKLLGVPFVGKTVEHSFATGNVRMHGDFPRDQALAYLHRGHLITYFPLPDGQHRFILASPRRCAPTGDVTLEEIQQAIEICGPKGSRASNPSFLARYHVHQRKVTQYVHQRVMLAGDAAHLHSPLGAQGMNTGMQDAMNLAWKLGLVVQDRAPARLLESYQIEREEVGRRLLQDDEGMVRQAFLHHPLATPARDCAAPYLTQHSEVQQAITRTAAELSISYQYGPLVSDYRGKGEKPASPRVHVGDRAPNGLLFSRKQAVPCQLYDLLTGKGHALLVFQHHREDEVQRELQAAVAPWQDLLEVYPIRRHELEESGGHTWYDPDGLLAERYGVEDSGLVLIRPDGYMSFRSRPIAAEPLRCYLRAHFSHRHT